MRERVSRQRSGGSRSLPPGRQQGVLRLHRTVPSGVSSVPDAPTGGVKLCPRTLTHQTSMLSTTAHIVIVCAVRTRYCTFKTSRSVQTEPVGRLIMRLLVLCLVLWGTTTRAEPPPPVPPEGLVHYKNEACVDPVWGLQGVCYYSHDVRNNYYYAFYDERNICMFIMQRVDGEYKELWRRSADT